MTVSVTRDTLFFQADKLKVDDLRTAVERLISSDERPGVSSATQAELAKMLAVHFARQTGEEAATLPEFITDPRCKSFLEWLSPYGSVNADKLVTICGTRPDVKRGKTKKKADLVFLLVKDDVEGDRLARLETLEKMDHFRRALTEESFVSALQFCSPTMMHMVSKSMLEWICEDNKYCCSREVLHARVELLDKMLDHVMDTEPGEDVKDLRHYATYRLVQDAAKKAKLYHGLLGKAESLPASSASSASTAAQRLQHWSFLNSDNFEIYDPRCHELLATYGSDNTTTAVERDRPSVFNLRAEEVLMEHARGPQGAAFDAMHAHFDAINTTAIPPRPEHERIVEVLRKEWAALKSFLRAFGSAIRDSYFQAPEDTGMSRFEQGHREGTADAMQRLQDAMAARAAVLSRGQDTEQTWCNRAALVKAPTGTGKTVMISLAPYAVLQDGVHHTKRVLVVTPNLEIRKQLADPLSHDPNHKNTLRDTLRAVTGDWLPTYYVLGSDNNDPPSAGQVSDRVADVVVTNIDQLQNLKRLQQRFSRDHFDLIIFDEGHHAAANSYKFVQEYFGSAHVLLLTATDFRGDGRDLDADNLPITYTIADGIRDRYTKNVVYEPLALRSVEIMDTVTKNVLEELTSENFEHESQYVKYREAATKSPAARSATIAAVLARLRALRSLSGYKHQAIAQARDIADARALANEFNSHEDQQEGEGFLEAVYVDSNMPPALRTGIMPRLREQEVAIVVHVDTLGEGFDLPSISVCALFKTFGSIRPFTQFVGRAVRRIPERADSDEENTAYVIAHPLLGYHLHWEVYKEERQDDQSELKGEGKVENIGISRCNPLPAGTAGPLHYYVDPATMPPLCTTADDDAPIPAEEIQEEAIPVTPAGMAPGRAPLTSPPDVPAQQQQQLMLRGHPVGCEGWGQTQKTLDFGRDPVVGATALAPAAPAAANAQVITPVAVQVTDRGQGGPRTAAAAVAAAPADNNGGAPWPAAAPQQVGPLTKGYIMKISEGALRQKERDVLIATCRAAGLEIPEKVTKVKMAELLKNWAQQG